VIGNVVRRVLGLIRDEATEDRNADDLASEAASDIQSLAPSTPHPPRPGPTPIRPSHPGISSGLQVSKSMFNLLSVAEPGDTPVTGASTPLSQAQPASVHALRSEVMDGIEEILDEINQADDQIAGFADIQIHPGDYVLAYQPSRTVERFLVKAASKRKFTVIIASLESPRAGPSEAPYAALRKKLNAAGVNTINLASNGLMAYIPRVNKVIFSAKAVYQNGGLLVDSGSCIAAQAAHEYLKPVIVLSPVYKFCPEDPSDEVSRGELGNPSSYVSYANGPAVDALDVENTVTDYIPPELIDVYLTNLYVASRNSVCLSSLTSLQGSPNQTPSGKHPRRPL
jgi:translation initiation factor eIF-2B subunit beta